MAASNDESRVAFVKCRSKDLIKSQFPYICGNAKELYIYEF